MRSPAQNDTRASTILETEQDTAGLRRHLKEVVEGEAFRGSHRSGQFLTYIVEELIAGHLPALKERSIGVKLFGRAPSYDTGEDAIVRVTASDVRKRLLQHYGKYGTNSGFRISLPLRSYIPEITHERPESTNQRNPSAFAALPVDTPEPVPASRVVRPLEKEESSSRERAGWLLFSILFIGFNAVMWGIFWHHFSRTGYTQPNVLPWSALLQPQRPTTLITSDPNIVEVQDVTGSPVTLSDYANQQYIPNISSLTPQIIAFCRIYLRGDKAAAVDASLVASIAELAQSAFKKINVHVARDVRFSDLEGDDNFIFLGSPRSNLWTSVFNDQLDFRFVFDDKSHQEIIRNVHPLPGEASSYVPTAKGWATGQSFATISFVQNPGRDGQVLILAGANSEGTRAAGGLITNMPRLSTALQRCGITSANPVRHFQILLRLNTMAGSASNVDVLACHVLHGSSAR